MAEERVQKVLSRMGFGSRREIETWIEQGRVKINRGVAKLGDHVTDGDRVELNDRRAIVSLETGSTRVIAYNKPEGEICSRKDEKKRASVYKNLPKISNGRWVGIGRLDINTSGLLLFTNNGELANKLMHPSSELEREYATRVHGTITDQQLEQLKKGVMLDDGPANFERIEDAGGEGTNHWYHVVLKEGRNREVRRLWESQQVQVSRLIRVRYGLVRLPRNLRQRKAIELAPAEVKQLAAMVGYKIERPDADKKPVRGARGRAASNEKPVRARSRTAQSTDSVTARSSSASAGRATARSSSASAGRATARSSSASTGRTTARSSSASTGRTTARSSSASAGSARKSTARSQASAPRTAKTKIKTAPRRKTAATGGHPKRKK